ncbi:iron ABC transporter permease [bacterium]|nr:iron ABC transporter permease [bacterium]
MIILAVVSLMVGSRFYSLPVLIETFNGGGDDGTRTIIWSLRFPRMIMAFEVGAALALAGLALQALLKNPLVEPYLIGASSGAAFGATAVLVFLPILLGVFAAGSESQIASMGTRTLMSIAAFLGALAAISFLYISSYKKGDFSTKRLILMGVVLGAFLSSFVALMIIASGESLRQVIWWLMGSLEIGPRGGWVILGFVLIIVWIYLFARSYKLNLLSQGEETALGLGVRIKSLKREILIAAAILTAAAVSMSGVIGFVGLIVPHFFRMVHGPDNRVLIPITGLGGGLLLMAADLVAQNVLPVGELPIGIITTILGAPFFWLVLRTPAGER